MVTVTSSSTSMLTHHLSPSRRFPPCQDSRSPLSPHPPFRSVAPQIGIVWLLRLYRLHMIAGTRCRRSLGRCGARCSMRRGCRVQAWTQQESCNSEPKSIVR